MHEDFTLYHGDCLQILPTLADGCVDAVITDPPYSSGGRSGAELRSAPEKKYVQGGQAKPWATFRGDNFDQRSWTHWCSLWLAECWRIVRPGGYILMFSDWRQLPAASDALQMGGFVWRGTIAWDKGRGARAPHKGYFRHQCEYIL